MKECLMAGALAIGLLLLAHYADAQSLTPAQLALKAKVEGIPEIRFAALPNSGVATNSNKRYFRLRSRPSNPIFKFNQTGTFPTSWMKGLYGLVFFHVLRVDPQDNLWAADGLEHGHEFNGIRIHT
jgi:hypothetical protein